MTLEEAVKNNEAKVKEAFKFRMLPYAELKNCNILRSGVLSWKYKDHFDKGESLGYFNKDFSSFTINEHWSERMRKIERI